MNAVRSFRIYFLLSALILVLACRPAAPHAATKRPDTCPAKANSAAVPATTIQNAATGRDGQHDFDFNLGTWHTQIKRLLHPLTGSSTWVEMSGSVVVRKVGDGRGQLEEIEADGSAGHFEGLTLFLYNPQSHQWSQYFSNRNDGTIAQPAIGDFKNGRGEFYDQETFQGRAVLLRIVWSDITPDAHHFEQSFSDDGGKTGEPIST